MCVERILDLLAERCKPRFLQQNEQPRGWCDFFWGVFVNVDMLKSISQDANFALTWWYYADETKQGQLPETLEGWLLAVAILHSVVYVLFVAYDLFANLVYCGVSCFHFCGFNKDCTDSVWKRCYWAPREIYSFGMIKIYGIIFVDVFMVVLTFIIQSQKGEDRGSLALANIVASFFNLVVKVLEAIKFLYDMTKDKRNLIATFKGHKFDEPIFVGKLSGTQTYVSASMHKAKVWKRTSWTDKREMWSFPVNNEAIEVKCMAVLLGFQGFILAWQPANAAQGTRDVHVYNYGDGTTSPIPSSSLPHGSEVFSVAVLAVDEIVVAAGSAVTWKRNDSGQWTESLDGVYGTPDSDIRLAAKFGDDFLLTAAPERSIIAVWRRNSPEVCCCSFEHINVQNMFELGYEERKSGACSARFVTHTNYGNDQCVRVWKFENIRRPPDLEIVLATDAFSMGIVDTGDHRRLLIGSIKGTVSFWKVGPLVLEKIVSAHGVPVTCLSQSEENELLTGSMDRTVRLWSN